MSWLLSAATRAMEVGTKLVDKITEVEGDNNDDNADDEQQRQREQLKQPQQPDVVVNSNRNAASSVFGDEQPPQQPQAKRLNTTVGPVAVAAASAKRSTSSGSFSSLLFDLDGETAQQQPAAKPLAAASTATTTTSTAVTKPKGFKLSGAKNRPATPPPPDPQEAAQEEAQKQEAHAAPPVVVRAQQPQCGQEDEQQRPQQPPVIAHPTANIAASQPQWENPVAPANKKPPAVATATAAQESTKAAAASSSSFWNFTSGGRATLFSAIEAGAGALISTLDAANNALDRANTSEARAAAELICQVNDELQLSSFCECEAALCEKLELDSHGRPQQQQQACLPSHLESLATTIFDLLLDPAVSSSVRDNVFTSRNSDNASAAAAAASSPAFQRIEALSADFISSTRSWYTMQSKNRKNGENDDDDNDGNSSSSKAAARTVSRSATMLQHLVENRLRSFVEEWTEAVCHEVQIFGALVIATLSSSSVAAKNDATTAVPTNLGELTNAAQSATALLSFCNAALQQLELGISAVTDVVATVTLDVLQKSAAPVVEAELREVLVQNAAAEDDDDDEYETRRKNRDELRRISNVVQTCTELVRKSRRVCSRWAGAAVAIAETEALSCIRSKLLAATTTTAAAVDVKVAPVSKPAAPRSSTPPPQPAAAAQAAAAEAQPAVEVIPLVAASSSSLSAAENKPKKKGFSLKKTTSG